MESQSVDCLDCYMYKEVIDVSTQLMYPYLYIRPKVRWPCESRKKHLY